MQKQKTVIEILLENAAAETGDAKIFYFPVWIRIYFYVLANPSLCVLEISKNLDITYSHTSKIINRLVELNIFSMNRINNRKNSICVKNRDFGL